MKILTLIRGLPGSGKSTLGRTIDYGIVGELSKICKSVAYKNENTKYVYMYGYRVEKELIEDCANMNMGDVTQLFEELHKLGKFEYEFPDTRKRKRKK